MKRLLLTVVLCAAWIPITAATYVGGMVLFASRQLTAADAPRPGPRADGSFD
jgi:hypothetical protein